MFLSIRFVSLVNFFERESNSRTLALSLIFLTVFASGIDIERVFLNQIYHRGSCDNEMSSSLSNSVN